MLSDDKTTVLMCNKNGCDASMTFLRGTGTRPTRVVRRRSRFAVCFIKQFAHVKVGYFHKSGVICQGHREHL